MNKLVSVIIPVFNAEKYILATLQSVLEQTYPHFEIIIVNDGSTDLSISIIEGINSDKIKLIHQPNQGASYAKQTGLNAAKGEYIQYLDADDILSANKLSVQVDALSNHPAKVAVCSTVHFKNGSNPEDSTPTPYEEKFLYSTDDPVSFLINLYGGNGQGASMIQPNAFLSPADIIKKAGPWNTELSPSPDEDGEYFCRVILASDGLIHTADCLNYYRRFETKTSLSSLKTQKGLTMLFKSTLLKKEHLLKRIDTPQSQLEATAKRALSRELWEIAVASYPKYSRISDTAIAEARTLWPDTPSYFYRHTPFYRFITNLFGWKASAWLSYLKNVNK